MGSWLIIIILILLLMSSIGMIILLRWDIRKMTNQLDEIINNFGTNELVRTNTQSKSLIRFATKINQLIHLFKQDQQSNLKTEKELKQEITNISHDLRTPLTSIKGFSELLTDPTISDLEKEEFLAIIQKKINTLTMIVDLFYELSQIDSLDKKLVMEEQLLNQIVVEAMLISYDDFGKTPLTVHVDEVTVSPIFADEKLTNRIVTNIIQNAFQHAKSYVTINFIEENEYVRLSVINDIDALDHTEIDRIFDRTYRLDTSRSSGNLGLGLHIVQRLINKQGGRVDVDVHKNQFRIDVSFKKWN